MWNLTPEFCAQIPQKKAKYVITSLTCYKKDIIKDKSMFHILNDLYEKIYFWPQQLLDIEYLKTLELDFPITILPPVLSVYDQLLSKGNIDYVGSRLHGGIRALNHCCRTLIVGVDNRAVEIHNDTNLPVMERSQIESKLESWVNTNRETNIVLPQDNIDKWKSQFC